MILDAMSNRIEITTAKDAHRVVHFLTIVFGIATVRVSGWRKEM